jgi:hypothetical protein
VVERLKQAAMGKITKINLRTSNGDSVTFGIKQHCDRKPQFFRTPNKKTQHRKLKR